MNIGTSRRDFLKAGLLSFLGLAGVSVISQVEKIPISTPPHQMDHDHTSAMPMPTGEVNHELNGFDPSQTLTDFDYGVTSLLPDGRTLREYSIFAAEQEVEIAPGIPFAAWTYNGRIPGPTLRCTEGDLIRIHFQNLSSHPHSMHFHGIHSAEMDGVPGSPSMVTSGGSFTYEFTAEPFG
ncbi:MAG: putative oxidoreductase, partial [Chloroflexi bacterium]|nr:putative oxidoreductase [Chloroflexota bacterium]